MRSALTTIADSASAASCYCVATVTTGLDHPHTAALAERLKALADPRRLRILDLLVEQLEALCVCDITNRFDLRQPTISHHLRILREARLISGAKRGVWSYYRAADEDKRSLSPVRTLM